MLKTRNFEKLGITTKLLGFGCMRFPTKDGKIDEEKALVMIDEAYKAGVNYTILHTYIIMAKANRLLGRHLKNILVIHITLQLNFLFGAFKQKKM